METKGSPLLPMLRSRVQGDMLATLFLDPEHAYSLTDLARRAHASVRAVHAEANRLTAAQWVTEERAGNSRMLRANTNSIIARPLTDLLTVTYGPLPLLTQALSGMAGIEHAYIYGSWAARHEGKAGGIPKDIDLLVVGDADPDDLAEAVVEVTRRLNREVDVRRVRAERWANPGDDPFLLAVQSRPLVELPIGEAIK